MATASQWIAGARPRTLPAAVAPVVAGTGAALYADGEVWWKAVVCLLLSLALQIGVNYANDYSDGVKGTDDDRVGPMRLVGSGAASAGAVKRAAFACFGVGGALGLALAATSGWWLVLVGVAAIGAAWFYTGGARPYGYRALGEVSVFVFFGLVAVLGTTYVQVGEFTGPSLAASIGIGALACAILVANNIRDIPTDTVSGKRTLAVVLGERGSRTFFIALLVVALVTVWWLASYTPGALLGLLAFPWALRAATPVARGARGLGLLPTLRDTGIAELVYAVGIAVGLAVGA
ncbi:1,4-dihydroxy-2-naphthoate polyprenyltransferase [Mumia zhuanghuii]|uniref:1,4-dihydroxy-2-naphthoate octaprenyltransferase n=1 Tax=Mumia zhuanghuii TaxID=2585211 RepID=A0A5C4MGY6_9ACTN|nr:1,4-dihydroxy-2-naphthoate polyprenyltransferase [Mumia zhuanghuii]TNC40984.1 1,4-dihydroxy-2-naphthoate polyprenyltransferase [Mumia zhuanghuii]TNC49272.1 1,4-dihydroxy-2-naphthoate polyprenyltransferase [Mumia zhuanghuii]